jgi:hypothetical protein
MTVTGSALRAECPPSASLAAMPKPRRRRNATFPGAAPYVVLGRRSHTRTSPRPLRASAPPGFGGGHHKEGRKIDPIGSTTGAERARAPTRSASATTSLDQWRTKRPGPKPAAKSARWRPHPVHLAAPRSRRASPIEGERALVGVAHRATRRRRPVRSTGPAHSPMPSTAGRERPAHRAENTLSGASGAR